MASTLFGTCGGDMGGQGEFNANPPPPCQLVITSAGLTEFLDKLTGFMFGWYGVSLFQNDHHPRMTDTVADYVPASFSGNIGRQVLYGWTPGTMYGRRAKSFATLLVWRYNGGAITNDIFGYFVTDPGGQLKFAERFCDGPIHMNVKGRKIRVLPEFETINEGDEQL